MGDIELTPMGNGDRRTLSVGTFPDFAGDARLITFSKWYQSGTNWQGLGRPWRLSRGVAANLAGLLESYNQCRDYDSANRVQADPAFGGKINRIIRLETDNSYVVILECHPDGNYAACDGIWEAIPASQVMPLADAIRGVLRSTESAAAS